MPYNRIYAALDQNKTNMKYRAFGEYKKLKEWARDPRCVVSVSTLINRYNQGMSIEQAMTIRRLKPGDVERIVNEQYAPFCRIKPTKQC